VKELWQSARLFLICRGFLSVHGICVKEVVAGVCMEGGHMEHFL
jgi:hypothetical protein